MNIFKRYTKLLLCSAGFAGAALVAGCGGGDQGREPILGVPAADLVSVAVTPATPSVAIGATQQFVATAAYSDGSARDVTKIAAWTSSAPGVATVNATTGMAVGIDAGSAAIAAAFEGQRGSAMLTVLPAKLVSIAVAPAVQDLNVGNTQQYVAIGTFENNTTRDITAVSTFASASPAVASIEAIGGKAQAKAAGRSVISATSGGLQGSAVLNVLPAAAVSLAVTPASSSAPAGATRQLAAFATYTDGSVVDVTASTAFVSATPAAASVGNAGLLTHVAVGSSTITASFAGKTALATATTTAATLSGITVTPSTASVAPGAVQQFVAVATFSDNSTSVVTRTAAWTSSNTDIATVLNTGAATGIAAGSATITATLDGKSGSARLTVTSAPPPASASINLGSASSFAVLAGTSLTNNAGGTTLVTGDVGSPSQTTDPVQAAGFTNYKSGAVLDNALADLQTAITDANSRTCDVTFAGDIDLGGLVLAPGVYCYSGAISVTGTLTLNGSGVYLFRTALTLNTTANSVIALTNGATAGDLTWVPVGPSTLGANSAFKGSILARSAAITVGDNTTLLNGRVLSAAAVTLRNNKITK
ncbi:Ig-like domain-containing protein [Massilia sp. H6]|uniref:Ig-like domain-containing protein n=1 Tax=Massilia sp. H6 TaxID=2970464 RepID=UPI00216829CD|nr:ice-binding family protein [Massilia sp. H6]UVW28547.1 Ig-like domain-containing protein [Massilia sp. H6]